MLVLLVLLSLRRAKTWAQTLFAATFYHPFTKRVGNAKQISSGLWMRQSSQEQGE
jgi:hypothetical protein